MRGTMIAVALAALAVAPAAAQEAGPTEREAAVLLAEGDWRERIEGLEVALELGPRASPELRLAVIDAAWAEMRGETNSPPESEAIFEYWHAVAGLRDPRAIPLLVEVVGNGSNAVNALADFGAEALPAVIAAVSDPGEDQSRVRGGLSVLRFLLEDGVLTAGQVERVRPVVPERLSGSQDSGVVRAAVRLALALGDPELRVTVERIADDRAAAGALVSPLLPSGNPREEANHAQRVDVVQRYARTFLDGGGADIGPVRRPWGGAPLAGSQRPLLPLGHRGERREGLATGSPRERPSTNPPPATPARRLHRSGVGRESGHVGHFRSLSRRGDMAGDRTAIVAGGEGRNTPAAAHVASLALAGRASVASSLHRAARLATGSEHADGLAYPWHRRPPTTLAALRAGLADRYAVATANASINAIRGALRAARLSGDMDRAMLERSLAALRQVRGNAAPGRALSPVEARKLFELERPE